MSQALKVHLHGRYARAIVCEHVYVKWNIYLVNYRPHVHNTLMLITIKIIVIVVGIFLEQIFGTLMSNDNVRVGTVDAP